MRLAYYRTSTGSTTVESQRHAMGGAFDREFIDHDVSGMIAAADRPAFGELLAMVREGDSLSVFAVDRLGRDAIDILTNARHLVAAGVVVDVLGLGPITGPAGPLILAVMAAFAESERIRILERTGAGMAAARRLLAETGQTQNGKTSIGRPGAADPEKVVAWRQLYKASAKTTAARFGISVSTVNRYCAEAGPGAVWTSRTYSPD